MSKRYTKKPNIEELVKSIQAECSR